jgi:uncharacterized protein YlxP (DUF503 family)
MSTVAKLVVVSIDLRVPHSNSLKDKRREVKSLKDKLRARLNASVAEIDYLEEWQRAVIAVAMIGNDKRKLERDISVIHQLLESNGNIDLIDVNVEWI